MTSINLHSIIECPLDLNFKLSLEREVNKHQIKCQISQGTKIKHSIFDMLCFRSKRELITVLLVGDEKIVKSIQDWFRRSYVYRHQGGIVKIIKLK